MDIILANPRGFCAGVDRAIEIVERALERLGAPIYVRHEVVHNKFVVDNLRARGAVFVDDLAEVPDDSIVIFSAHGVSRAVQGEAKRRGLRVFDATCPLVTKVHLEVEKNNQSDREVILIGHAGHPEVEGTMGQYETGAGKRPGEPESGIYLVESPEDVDRLQVKDPENLAYVTQTTLSVDDTNDIINALRTRFPNVVGPRKDDICYATQNRQDAVKALADECDVVLVVGSPNSSNSNRLVELARKRGRRSHLLDDPDQIDATWLDGVRKIGITAGASAPEALVERVIDRLKALGANEVKELEGKREKVFFPLPKALQ